MTATTQQAAELPDAGLPKPTIPEPICNNTLICHHEVIRRPLASWARSILNRIDELNASLQLTDDLPLMQQMVSCFNESALIEVHFGRTDRAAVLCASALLWLAIRDMRSQGNYVYRAAFQPHVNLGRLARLRGHWKDSLSKFQTVRAAVNGEPVFLGPVEVPPEGLRQCPSDIELEKTLRNIYISDSIKTFLKARRYKELVEFASSDPEFARDIVQQQCFCEARILGFLGIGMWDCAAELAASQLANRTMPHRPVFQFRRAEAFALAGKRDAALHAAKSLVNSFLRYPGTLGTDLLVLLSSLAKLLVVLASFEGATQLGELGFRAASQLGDVVLQCDFLKVLAACSQSAEARNQINGRLELLQEECWYGRACALSAVERSSAKFSILDELFKTLLFQTGPTEVPPPNV
jgi:hypothetical protein